MLLWLSPVFLGRRCVLVRLVVFRAYELTALVLVATLPLSALAGWGRLLGSLPLSKRV